MPGYFETASRPILSAATVVALRAVASNLFADGQIARVVGIATFYDWAPGSLAADDGATVVKPDDIPALSPGRWVLSPLLGASGGGPTGDYTNLPGAVSLRDVVFISAGDQVALADADNPATVPAIGVVSQIIDATNCRVTLVGEVGGFGGLVANEDYYLDTVPGGITTTPPSTSGSVVQKIGTARDATTLVVDIEPEVVIP